MENSDALLAILLLKQPLVESFRVFNNPTKIPQWILLQIPELKEFFSLVPTCTLLNPHLVECLFTELSVEFLSSVHSLHLLNAHLEELSKSLVILASSELITEFFLCALCALAQCPPEELHRIPQSFYLMLNSKSSSSVHSLHWLNTHLTELHRTPQRFCLQLCFSPQPCLQGIQQP
jgi:hypothetical protein